MSDPYVTVADRSQEERDYRNDSYNPYPPGPIRSEATPHCLVCGWPVETARHFGHEYTFDRNTETIHVCKPTFRQSMARLRREERNR